MASNSYPLIIIGAGASGLMAAIFAAQSGKKVIILDGSDEPGKKILLTGGKRCNILPATINASDFYTDSSLHTLKKIIRSWPIPEMISFFEYRAGIPLVEEKDTRKFFPASHKAGDVRNALVRMAKDAGCAIKTGVKVISLEKPESAHVPWIVNVDKGGSLQAQTVILAAGGLSYPSTGSNGSGFGIAGSLGHIINPTYPALAPLVLDPPRFGHLAGLSIEASLTVIIDSKKITSNGGFLFTHRGYSGPAVLDISRFAGRAMINQSKPPIRVCWTAADEESVDRLLREERGSVNAILGKLIPTRLAGMLILESRIPADLTAANLRREDRLSLISNLFCFDLPFSGTEGYGSAEVTGGGVALEEINPQTMESRRHSGLFICGEMLDAVGRVGGFNLAWAWITGRMAGVGAGRME